MQVRLLWNQLEVALVGEAGMTEMDTWSGYWMTEFFCLDRGYRVIIHKMHYVICWFFCTCISFNNKSNFKKIFKRRQRFPWPYCVKSCRRRVNIKGQGHFLIFTLNLWCPSKKGVFFQTKSSAYYALKWKSITFRKCQSVL